MIATRSRARAMLRVARDDRATAREDLGTTHPACDGAGWMRLADHAARLALVTAGVRSRWIDSGQARHHVYDARGRGSSPTIVLLHGLADSAASHARLLLRLRGQARRVIAIDAAGHGLSGRPRGAYTVDHHVESITQVLDQLLDEPALLAGNSLGGATALHYAITRPARVAALFLTSPAGAPSDELTRADLRDAFAMRRHADARAFVTRVHHGELAALRACALAALLRARTRALALDELFDSADQRALEPAELRALAMPVVLIWGRSERLLPRAHLEYFRRHLPRHAVVIEADGFGHCPHLDDAPRVADLIADLAAASGREITSTDR